MLRGSLFHKFFSWSPPLGSGVALLMVSILYLFLVVSCAFILHRLVEDVEARNAFIWVVIVGAQIFVVPFFLLFAERAYIWAFFKDARGSSQLFWR